jgi:molybdopterin synthase sulfur carrier subunit
VTVRIRYFASLREAVGRAEVTLDLPATVKTGRDLLRVISGQFPRAAEHFSAPGLKIALDHELATFDAPLAGVKEIALFPPVTGG